MAEIAQGSPTPKPFTCVCTTQEPRICQGDILRNVEYIEHVLHLEDKIQESTVVFPFVVVLTQDCDLEQDHSVRTSDEKTDQDKQLFSILVAPLYNYEHVRDGDHLCRLAMKMQKISSKKMPYIRNNEISRYHYLEFDRNEVPIPPSVIDFKHYFSVNVEYLKKRRAEHWVCKIAELHRENLCQRFAAFLARIGLPNPDPKR